jgi:hypothetical protein
MRWVKYSNNVLPFFNEVILDFRVPVTPTQNPIDSAKFTVDYIIKNYPAPYTLLVSGGIDSQAMLWAWIISKKEFSIVSAKYNYNLNDHDLNTLKEFCQKYSVNLKFVNFDLFKFLENDLNFYANKYRCSSPQICAYMKIADTIQNGTVIFSGNFLSPTGAAITNTTLGLFNYSNESGRPTIPFFFLETPALAYSFLSFFKKINIGDSYLEKTLMYQEGGFPIIPQKQKYTGFEQVKDYYDINFQHLVTVKHKLLSSNNHSKRVFDVLYRNHYENKFNYTRVKFILNPDIL